MLHNEIDIYRNGSSRERELQMCSNLFSVFVGVPHWVTFVCSMSRGPADVHLSCHNWCLRRRTVVGTCFAALFDRGTLPLCGVTIDGSTFQTW